MSVKILLTEDDSDNQDLFTYVLQRAGYTVLHAHNGIEAIEIARREQPALILMDLAMPEMDGWTAAERLKSDPVTQEIPVVALTVRSTPQDKIRAIEAGVNGYLTKPMNLNNFIRQVANYVEPPEQE
jgi:two-component system, cell cycle response regulator DivK